MSDMEKLGETIADSLLPLYPSLYTTYIQYEGCSKKWNNKWFRALLASIEWNDRPQGTSFLSDLVQKGTSDMWYLKRNYRYAKVNYKCGIQPYLKRVHWDARLDLNSASTVLYDQKTLFFHVRRTMY